MGQKEYFLGLDLGTSSVGWAVTDMNYQLLRARGKDLWGIREFDEAKTSVDRRTNRISRRRRQREQVRIGMLKEYFHDAIAAVDPYFYQRLENSKYHVEDKDEAVRYPHGIFHDVSYTDRDYYAQYPTIFHLRKELIYNKEPHDVRFIFLAILNMFKHRGHFLNTSLSGTGEMKKMDSAYQELLSVIAEWTEEVRFPREPDITKIQEILSSREYSRTRKTELLTEALQITGTQKREVEILKGLCGRRFDVSKAIPEFLLDEKMDICFSDAGYEEKAEEYISVLGEERFRVIESMKEIYEIGTLSEILQGHSYLSDARVALYEKHAGDLKILKSLIRKYGTPDDYNHFFRCEEKGFYSAYVNSFNAKEKQRRGMKERKQEDLYGTIKKYLRNMPEEDENVQYVYQEMEKNTFLPKQLTASNGIIPNQVHEKELRKILENAESYLGFLQERDASGLSVSERILKLFSFQIPYYVGPVSERSAASGGNGWVVRKEPGQVLPWNIAEKIDMRATSERFIENLIRNCTYISGEKVLPKASLEYESFCVLNEINNLRIDDVKISVELKQELYKKIFQKGKRVTRRQIVHFLLGQGAIEKESQVTGIDVSVNHSLSSYGKFRAIFGEDMEKDAYKRMVEDIIRWCTIYGDDKKFLKDQLESRYPGKISGDNLKRILGMKFRDWGRLSKACIELSGCDKSTGEIKSLIRTMWDTNLNFMELIHSDQYTYAEELQKKQISKLASLSELRIEDLDEFYFSAPVKRMVWQTLLLIRELQKLMGGPPKRIFIEMTRSEGEKGNAGRTTSRARQLMELYKNIKDEERDWRKAIEAEEKSGRLRSKKMYLYFTQMGRCMYTGKKIDLEDLFNDNLYDIDHIYPRHYVKDDNINSNLVLVYKPQNAHKSDEYPLDITIVSNPEIRALWELLRQKKLITEEKYRRLTSRQPFTDEQKAGFIARQLVETSQGTKSVAELLKQLLPESTVVYSKASNVADFRRHYDLMKSRLVNDFHHANDAYLNIVVGNVYYVKFTQNPLHFIKREAEHPSQKNHYHLYRMFDWDVRRNGETAWLAESEQNGHGTIATVKGVMRKNTPIMTRMNYVGHGEIANATLYSARKAQKAGYLPLKTSDERLQDVSKYGGFTSLSTAYFFLVEHGAEGKRIRTLETVPIYMAACIEKNRDALKSYCVEALSLVNPDIRLARIKLHSLIKYNGYLGHITGISGKRIYYRNAVNLCLSAERTEYIRLLEKYQQRGRLAEEITAEKNMELYRNICEKHNTGIYSMRPNPMGKRLSEGEGRFATLSLENQCDTLLQILQLTAIGLPRADLKMIGGTASAGIMLLSKNISKAHQALLVNQSVTGIYENIIDLLTV